MSCDKMSKIFNIIFDLNNLKSVIRTVSYAHRSLSELEGLRVGGDMGEKIRQVTERATLFRITSNAMINVKLPKCIKLPSKAFFADSLAYISLVLSAPLGM